jgi:sRNA-binding carbon storage regulator CsrA
MLLIDRKTGERIRIDLGDGREIIVTICATTTSREPITGKPRGHAKVGIAAPETCRITRDPA